MSLRKVISIAVLTAFICTSVKAPVYAQMTAGNQVSALPVPGTMVHLSPEFTPAYLKGIVIHPNDPFKFDFIVYKGDLPLSDDQKREEYTKLIKYFLASLAVPDDDQWVNLSPYEKNRIIKEDFGKTQMGRDLLAEDYLLKQITGSLIYPGDDLGKKFWDRVYAKAEQEYGTTNVPVNTFNKVWITPDSALIFEKGNMAYVVRQHLKVMLEEDYLSLKKHTGLSNATADSNKAHTIASQIIKEIVLPELEKEVNEGKNFASLRQVYSGMLLAAWYKRALRESILTKIYADKSQVKGIDQDPQNNEAIYRQYLKAYKKGVFNFIKEDVDKYTHETIPRKYFSGGVRSWGSAFNKAMITHDAAMAHADLAAVGGEEDVVTEENTRFSDQATLSVPAANQSRPIETRIFFKNGQPLMQAEIRPEMGGRYFGFYLTTTHNHDYLLGVNGYPVGDNEKAARDLINQMDFNTAESLLNSSRSLGHDTLIKLTADAIEKRNEWNKARQRVQEQYAGLIREEFLYARDFDHADKEAYIDALTDLDLIFKDDRRSVQLTLETLKLLYLQHPFVHREMILTTFLHNLPANVIHNRQDLQKWYRAVIQQTHEDWPDGIAEAIHNIVEAGGPDQMSAALRNPDSAMMTPEQIGGAIQKHLNEGMQPGNIFRGVSNDKKYLYERADILETLGELPQNLENIHVLQMVGKGQKLYSRMNTADAIKLIGQTHSFMQAGLVSDKLTGSEIGNAQMIIFIFKERENQAAPVAQTIAPAAPADGEKEVKRFRALYNGPDGEGSRIKRSIKDFTISQIDNGIPAMAKTNPEVLAAFNDALEQVGENVPASLIQSAFHWGMYSKTQDDIEKLMAWRDKIRLAETVDKNLWAEVASKNMTPGELITNFQKSNENDFPAYVANQIKLVKAKTASAGPAASGNGKTVDPRIGAFTGFVKARDGMIRAQGASESFLAITVRDELGRMIKQLEKGEHDAAFPNLIILQKNVFSPDDVSFAKFLAGRLSQNHGFGVEFNPKKHTLTAAGSQKDSIKAWLETGIMVANSAMTSQLQVSLNQVKSNLEGSAQRESLHQIRQAMAGENVKNGGIDLNAANLDLQIKRDGNGVPLPVSQQDLENIHIEGLIPVILDIKPAMATPLLSQLQTPGAEQRTSMS